MFELPDFSDDIEFISFPFEYALVVIQAHVLVVLQIDLALGPLHHWSLSFTHILSVVLLIEAEVVFRNDEVMSVAVEIDEVGARLNPDGLVRQDPLVFENDWRVIDLVETHRKIVLVASPVVQTAEVVIAENKEDPASFVADTLDRLDDVADRAVICEVSRISTTEPEVAEVPDVAVLRKLIERFQHVFIHALNFRNVSGILVSSLDVIRPSAVLDDVRVAEMSVRGDECLAGSLQHAVGPFLELLHIQYRSLAPFCKVN